MLRTFCSLLIAAALAASPLAAATLRSHVEVRGAMIRLGDLLDDAGAAAERVVARAPQPGERATLSVREIAAAARDAGISFRSNGVGYVTVARRGQAVAEQDLEERITRALATRGGKGPFRIRITSRRGPLYLPLSADKAELRVEDIDFDRRTGRFSATLALPGDGGIKRRISLSGVAEAERYIPVLTRALGPGDVIAARDIDWIRLPARQVNRTMITDDALLLGLEPVRPLRAGVPLRLSEVRRPVLVHKGAIVTMIVQRGGLLLSATGKAMQDGARDEVIRLQNTSTRRIIEGRVTGPERVDVMLPGALAALRTYGETP